MEQKQKLHTWLGEYHCTIKYFYLSPVSAVKVIESVPSVCLCMSQRSHGWTVGPMDLKFGMGMNLDNILDELKGRGHRSKFKDTILKNVIFI